MSAGCPGARETGLDISQLVQTVGELFQEGLAPATQKAYTAVKHRYGQFCNVLGVLQLFVASLVTRDGLAHSTIKNYLQALTPLEPWSSCVVVCRLCLVYNLTKFWL